MHVSVEPVRCVYGSAGPMAVRARAMWRFLEICVFVLRTLSSLVAHPVVVVVTTCFLVVASAGIVLSVLRGRRWPLLFLPPLLFAGGIAFCLGLLPGADWCFHTLEVGLQMKNITGVASWPGEAQLAYDSPRSFTGDGCSFYLFRLPSRVRQRFMHPDADPGDYPRKHFVRDRFTVVRWKRGPATPEDAPYLNFAFGYAPGESSDAADIVERARDALRKPTTWFSYLYHAPDGRVRDIDLFLIDPVEGNLIIVNHNT